MKIEKNNELYFEIANLVAKAREKALRKTNSILLNLYWNIGKIIIENEQNGNFKAKYGDYTLKKLSHQLNNEFGSGFDERNLNNMRAFYLAFPIWNAVSSKLTWTHYRILSRIENKYNRNEYVKLSIESNWNTRELQRNIKSDYLGRILEVTNEKKNAK